MTALGLLYLALTLLADIVSAALYAMTDLPEVAYLRFGRDGLGLALAAVGLFNSRLPRGVRWTGVAYLGLIGVYFVAGAADTQRPLLLVASAAQLSIPVVLTLVGAGSLSSPSGVRMASALTIILGVASTVFGMWDSRNTDFWTNVIAYGDYLYEVKRILVGYHPITLLPWNFFGFEGLRRAAGLVAAPLAQGAFLSIVAVVVFARYRERAPIRAYLLLALAAFGIYQSGTRGAILTLVLALPLVVALARVRLAEARGPGVGLDIALLAIGLAFSFQTLAFIFSYTVGLEDGSTIGHVRSLQRNLRDLPGVLIFGEGLAAAGAAAADAGLDIAGGGEGSIFSIAFQIGLPGAIIFLGFCAAIWRGLNQIRRNGGEFMNLAAALIALLISSAIHLVSSETVLSVSGMGSFWILVGAVVASQRSAAAKPADQAAPSP